MNNALIDIINFYVRPEDELWHLGDFLVFYCNKKKKLELYKERFNYLLSKIKCKNIKFIRGNHDEELDKVGVEWYDTKMIKTEKYGNFWLSHYCHLFWPKMGSGTIHCYGHSHGTENENVDKLLPNRRSLDIGIDSAEKLLGVYRPFSAKEIFERMKKHE